MRLVLHEIDFLSKSVADQLDFIGFVKTSFLCYHCYFIMV